MRALMSLNLQQQQQQQQPAASSQELNANYYTSRNSSNSNVGSKQRYCLDSDWTRRPQTATRSRARGTVLFSARLLHLPEITTLLSQYVISAVVLSHERTGRGTMEAPLGTRTKAHSRNYAPSHATIPAVNGSTKVTFENFRHRCISTRLSFCCCSRRCNINLVQISHAVRIPELLAFGLDYWILSILPNDKVRSHLVAKPIIL